MRNRPEKIPIIGDKETTHVEIWFDERESGGFYYAFRFLSGNQLLFNPEIMIHEVIRAYEYGDDYFIPFLEKLLTLPAKTHDYWIPIEPDVEIMVEVTEDYYTFHIMVDGQHTKAWIAKKGPCYVGNGPSVHIGLERKDLEKLIQEMKQEYDRFQAEN